MYGYGRESSVNPPPSARVAHALLGCLALASEGGMATALECPVAHLGKLISHSGPALGIFLWPPGLSLALADGERGRAICGKLSWTKWACSRPPSPVLKRRLPEGGHEAMWL